MDEPDLYDLDAGWPYGGPEDDYTTEEQRLEDVVPLEAMPEQAPPPKRTRTRRPPLLNWRTLSSLLANVKRQVVECGSTGNCFFDSVVYAMAPQDYTTRQTIHAASSNLRQRVSKWMADPANVGFFTPYGDVALYSDKHEPWPKYAEYIGKNKAWVQGSVEIIVTSIILQRRIDVYFYRYGLDNIPYLGCTPHGEGPPIEIAIIDESHYRAVVAI